MEFWLIFYFILLSCACCSFFFNEKNNKLLTYFVLFILWFVAAFRFEIGADYSLYQYWYTELVDIDIFNISEVMEDSHELSFILLVQVLNGLGFDYQMMFVVMETLIIFPVYKGFRGYIESYRWMVIALILYSAIRVDGSYLWSMNGMRQSIALAIVFWGSTYLYTKEHINFYISVFWGFLFHHSAVIGLIIPILKKFNISAKTTFFLTSLCLCASVSGLSAQVLTFLLCRLPYYGNRYGELLEGGVLNFQPHIGVGWLLWGCFLWVLLLCTRGMYGKTRELYVISTFYICIRLLSSLELFENVAIVTDVVNALLHRVDAFFVLFYIAYIVNGISLYRRIHFRCVHIMFFSIIIILMFSIHSYGAMQKEAIHHSSVMRWNSSLNYDYKFNFNIR